MSLDSIHLLMRIVAYDFGIKFIFTDRNFLQQYIAFVI